MRTMQQREEYGLIFCRLIVDLLKTAGTPMEGGQGVSVDLALICSAVFIGQAEGRPMTAGKLAAYIGIPRPTIIRKLQLLHTRGIVAQVAGGGWRIVGERPDIATNLDRIIEENSRTVRRACEQLSKLDNAAIERPGPRT